MSDFIITLKARKRERKGWLEVMDCFDTSTFERLKGRRPLPHVSLREISLKPGMGFVPIEIRNSDLFILPLQGSLIQRNQEGNKYHIRPGDLFVMSSGWGLNSYKYNGSKSENFKAIVLEMATCIPDAEPYCELLKTPDIQDGLTSLLPSSSDVKTRNNTHLVDLFRANLRPASRVVYEAQHPNMVLIHVLKGKLKIQGRTVEKGETTTMVKSGKAIFETRQEAEFLLFELNVQRKSESSANPNVTTKNQAKAS